MHVLVKNMEFRLNHFWTKQVTLSTFFVTLKVFVRGKCGDVMKQENVSKFIYWIP